MHHMQSCCCSYCLATTTKNHQRKQIASPDFLTSELDFNQSNQTSESEFQVLPHSYFPLTQHIDFNSFLLHSVDASENDQMKWNIFRLVKLISTNTFHSNIISGRCSSDWLFVQIQKPNSVINVHLCICIVSKKTLKN